MRLNSLLPYAAISLCLTIGGWFVTCGDGDFLAEKELRYGGFFDAQGESLLQGRLDVPWEVISSEAFVVDGRFYGYFGITPSLFRLPLNALFPDYKERWAPLSELAASAFFLLVAYGFVRELRKVLFPDCPLDTTFYITSSLYLIALGIGSTTIFLLSRPVLYHEAMIWSVALSLGSLLWAFKYWTRGGLRLLAITNVLALLAINARPVAGLATLIACFVIPVLRYLLRRDDMDSASGSLSRRRREVVVSILFVAIVFGSYLTVTYAKFRSLSGQPIQYNVQFTPERYSNVKGSMYHISNLAWNVSNYFGVTGWKLPFADSIPQYIYKNIVMSLDNHPEAVIDVIEPFMSIPVSITALAISSIVGIVGSILKRKMNLGFIVLALISLVGPLSLLFYAAVSYRYFHEYLLFMSLAGAAAVSVLCLHGERQKLLCSALLILLSINIIYNLLFSLVYQVYDTNVGEGIPAVMTNIVRWDNVITRLGW